MGFDEPGSSDFFEIKKHVGSLAIFAINEFMPKYVTTMGASDTVRAEVVIVDGPGAGQRYPDALIFGKKLVPQLKKVGSVILGRISQGQAKAGQSPPYILDKATAADVEAANAWTATNGDVSSKPVDSSTDTHSASGQPYAADPSVAWASQRQTQPAQYPQGQPPTNPYGAPPATGSYVQPDTAPF